MKNNIPNSIFQTNLNKTISIPRPQPIPEYIDPAHIKRIESSKIVENPLGGYTTLKIYRFVSNHPALTDAQVEGYLRKQCIKQDYQRMQKEVYLRVREEFLRAQAENFNAKVLKHQQEVQIARRKQMAQVAFEGVPVVGRTAPVKELAKEKEYLPMTNIFSQLALYGPEEIREIKEAVKQFRGNYTPSYNYKIAQHPFSYFRGTFLNKYINPFSDKCLLSKATAMKLCNFDKSLAETEFGYLVKNKLGYSEIEIPTDINDIYATKTNLIKLNARIINSNRPFARLVARTLLRLPIIGLIISGVLEISHIAHEVNRGEDLLGEISQATSRFIGTNLLTGIFGAIGSTFGPIGSILGASLGAMSSAALAKIFD